MSYTRPPVSTQAGRALSQSVPSNQQSMGPVILDCHIATSTQLGVVKQGSNISIAPDGTISSTGGASTLGTWIPVLVQSSGVIGSSISLTIKNAKYVKIGQLVSCTFDFQISNITGGLNSSVLTLRQLPETSISDIGYVGSLYISYFNSMDSNVVELNGTVISSSKQVDLWLTKTPGQSQIKLTQSDIKVGTRLIGTIQYISDL